MSKLLIVAFLWIVYGVIHSLLASNFVKRKVKSVFYLQDAQYRLFYVVVSFLTLIFPAIYLLSVPYRLVYENVFFRIVGVGIVLISVWLFPKAWQGYHFRSFIGLEEERYTSFIAKGFHKCVRHPLYSVSVILLIGIGLLFPYDVVFISVVTIFGYLHVGTYFEEQKLIQQFGEEYKRYKRCTPKFFPKFPWNLGKCLKANGVF